MGQADSDGDRLGDPCDPDRDGDRHANDDPDCAPDDPRIHPGAAETTCNGVDNDCDRLLDEGYVAEECPTGRPGACSKGMTSCSAGVVSCVPPAAVDERCDGLDNNCDGRTDESFYEMQVDWQPARGVSVVVKGLDVPCSAGVGSCKREGRYVCAASGTDVVCNAVAGLPALEYCDGQDNDCDNQTDEGFDVSTVCFDGRGECRREGRKQCRADGLGTSCNARAGAPGLEICDRKDNDCDGQTDEEVCFNSGGFMFVKGNAGRSCRQTCTELGWSYDPGGSGSWALDAANCQQIQRHFAPAASYSSALDCWAGCSQRSGRNEVQQCKIFGGPDSSWPDRILFCSCGISVPEVCDRKDNDLDGQTDEERACVHAGPRSFGGYDWYDGRPGASCNEVCASAGQRNIAAGSGGWAVEQANCATLGAAFAPGLPLRREPCQAGCNVYNSAQVISCERLSSADWAWADRRVFCSCATPVPETCDGRDNDLDGSTDEEVCIAAGPRDLGGFRWYQGRAGATCNQVCGATGLS
ncbi:MAG: hypothetical protein FJ125_17570, partial [Deltaproteobacteria bacterium]|nr:hypothetical protein [Deltaproteobacteria bacterium]